MRTLSENLSFASSFILQAALCFCISYSESTLAIQIESPCDPSKQVPGEYIVRIKKTNASLSAVSGEKIFSHPLSKIISHKLGSSNGSSASQSLRALKLTTIEAHHLTLQSDEDLADLSLMSGELVSIEHNCFLAAMTAPNDPDLHKNLGLQIIRAEPAWSTVHNTNVVVAVADTGVDLTHSDLTANLWKNQKEANGITGVDDDNNGYIDDINGWGFPEKSADPSPGSYDGSDHGTHVAGIIGATGNNGYGSVGVAWAVKIMPLRVFKKSANEATSSDIIEAVYYAANNGAQVLNCSWGAEQKPSKAELDAYAYAETKGVLVVAAAGNDSKDTAAYSPASISTVLAVGSVNSKHELSSFSNFGATISVLAPGGDIPTQFGTGVDEQVYSTVPGGGFDYKKGTSVSAPFVSGVAALIKALLPSISPSNIKDLIRNGGDAIAIKHSGVTSTYYSLNAEKAVSLAAQISQKNPNCTSNCIQSGAYDLSSSVGTGVSRFGGGGCSSFKATSASSALHNINSEETRSAESSPWDLAFLLSALAPSALSTIKDILKKFCRKNKKPQG